MLGIVLRTLNALTHLILSTNSASRHYSFVPLYRGKKSEPVKGLVTCPGYQQVAEPRLEPRQNKSRVQVLHHGAILPAWPELFGMSLKTMQSLISDNGDDFEDYPWLIKTSELVQPSPHLAYRP